MKKMRLETTSPFQGLAELVAELVAVDVPLSETVDDTDDVPDDVLVDVVEVAVLRRQPSRGRLVGRQRAR